MPIPETLIDAAVNLAVQLSSEQMRSLLRALQLDGAPMNDEARHHILNAVPLQPFATTVAQFLDIWQRHAPELAADSMVSLLHATALTAGRVRAQQQVSVIWTGPETRAIPLRRTEDALLEVIRAAQGELLVVSFAVYKARAIMQALEEAMDRGVHLRICVESPEARGGCQFAHVSVPPLRGKSVPVKGVRYVWKK